MHVVLTNDDGPPSNETSPYISFLVEAIRKYTDWKLSIVVPSSQKSWIGKAHMIGHDVTPSYIYTKDGAAKDYLAEGPYLQKKANYGDQMVEWTLLDATPATCANIGIHHLYEEKGPVDLVISGPNYGRNSTALYIMSSGTVGASMEAALCNVKSISLSYAFETRIHNPKHITEAARLSVRLCQYLYDHWDDSVDVYSVNVPLCETLNSSTKILYTHLLENKWKSVFEPQHDETGIPIKFNWKPDFAHVDRTVRESKDTHPGNDGWVVSQGMISVTPLKAMFQTVNKIGEITLKINDLVLTRDRIKPVGLMLVSSGDKYVVNRWTEVLRDVQHNGEFQVLFGTREDIPLNNKLPVLEYSEYDDLDFDRIMNNDGTYFACSYVYRKGLIRKHYLSNTVRMFVAKNPKSILKCSIPESFDIEVDFAEFLDDALDEAYELRQEIEKGEKTWILKPSMSDRAQGVRLFTTIEGLQEVFDSFEEEAEEEDETDGRNDSTSPSGIITSQLRHFVVQEYIGSPLLLSNKRKFHIRTYVLAVGAIRVYVYRDMLALFALDKYTPPEANENGVVPLAGHLTNTCIQGEDQDEQSVRRFWDLELSSFDATTIFGKICDITRDIFNAATTVDRINFQPLPNAFEMYGLDFIVTAEMGVYLLEVNAYPDFKQTGDKLNGIVSGFFNAVFNRAVVPLLGGQSEEGDGLVPVLERDLGI